MRRRRRQTRGGNPEPWRLYKPGFSYRPFASLVTLDGFNNVIEWADELAPTDASRNLSQAVVADRPAWDAISGSFPSGPPAVNGDAVSDFMASARADAGNYGASPYTMFALVSNSGTPGNRTTCGSSDVGGASRARVFPSGVNLQGQHEGSVLAGTLNHTTAYVGVLRWDGTTADWWDDQGGSASAVVGAAAVDRLSVFARLNGGTPQQFDDSDIAWFLGYPRFLADADRAVIVAAMQNYGGI